MKPFHVIKLVLLIVYSSLIAFSAASWLGRTLSTSSVGTSPLLAIRGGQASNDEERYSRQVYTLGAKAHGLIRSTTVYLDGPPASGLLYEIAKNLALSGVRRIVLVRSEESVDRSYHEASMDDLGTAFMRAARSEVGDNQDEPLPLLSEYIQRLNPSVAVTIVSRSEVLAEDDTSKLDKTAKKRVFVAIDRPHASQVSLNRLCRAHKVAFIAVETAGVFGRIFSDFGKSFKVYDTDGETPLVIPLDKLEIVPGEDENNRKIVMVRCVDGEKHDVSQGDMIQFQYRDGTLSNEKCIVTNVESPFRFQVEYFGEKRSLQDWVNHINDSAASFRRKKVPVKVKFNPLEVAFEKAKLDSSLFTPCDMDKSFDDARRSTSMACFWALSKFAEMEGRLPTQQDNDTVWKMLQSLDILPADKMKSCKRFCKAFTRVCAAKVAPFQAVFGAIGAQEALKAATGIYNPIQQFLFYDCDEILEKESTEVVSETPAVEARGLRYVLGDAVVEKLQSRKIFIVGAGAIGCEIIKNLASMGAGTLPGGYVCLTDMDTIEKSNLSRQFLFRDSDIGSFKSTAAHNAAHRFNPKMKIESHSSKVGDMSFHTPFDDTFWSKKVDVVLNALDNVEARLFMDGQCVANQKALVDAGTMGQKGNVQVVIPHQSESYASSADPPEPAIPVCTLKNFPYAISHTIQWGRDLFEGLFERRPLQANDFMSALKSECVDKLASEMVRQKGDDAALQAAEELKEDLSAVAGKDSIDETGAKASSLDWAAKISAKLFYESAVDLLRQHPLESVDEDGEPFWTGTRRPPRALSYIGGAVNDVEQQLVNANLIEFVRTAARLRFETLIPEHSGITFGNEEAEAALMRLDKQDVCTSDVNLTTVEERVKRLLGVAATFYPTMKSIEFEKDDDFNGHVDFVNAASNLRAMAYGIPPVDAMETRRVAGNIIPAMITTTAFVSGLSCIELIKIVQNAPLKRYRNAFINMALPFFAFTTPLPAQLLPGFSGRSYTLWDRLKVKEGKSASLTMRSLLRKLKSKVSEDPDSIDITSVSYGPYLLFASFLHTDDDEVLDSNFWELVENTINSEDDFDEGAREPSQETKLVATPGFGYIDLDVVAEDTETGEEIQLPPVRVQRRVRSDG